MAVREQTTFSTYEVARRCGLSYRMVDYWARTSKELRPTFDACGSGSRRRWTLADLMKVRKAALFSLALSPFTGGGRRSSQGMAVETVERFVIEAVENSVGDWVWECDDFTLIVAGEASRVAANLEAS